MDADTMVGWVMLVWLAALPLIFWAVGVRTRRAHRRGDADAPSSGGLLGFDELFHPSAHDARIAWEAEQEIPTPAPTPDRGPGVIEQGRRITIVV